MRCVAVVYIAKKTRVANVMIWRGKAGRIAFLGIGLIDNVDRAFSIGLFQLDYCLMDIFF